MNVDRVRSRRKLIPRFAGRSAARLLIAFAVAATPLVILVPEASAGVGFGVVPNFPAAASVGQTGLPASITITNLSNGGEATGTVTLNSITLTPSCGIFTVGTDCTVAGADPGVFTVAPTAVGRSGTACASLTFMVTLLNPVTGQLTFAPSGPVTLGPPSSATATCAIDFTFDVNSYPTKDVSPVVGLQTEQIAAATGFHQDGTPGGGNGSSFVTVSETTPPICALTAVIVGPPKQIQITVQDTGTGLAAAPAGIVVVRSINATVTVPPYAPGTTSPVVVTATKIDQTMRAEIALRITDRAGNETICDPTDVSLDHSTGGPLTQTVRDVPSAEHLLTVFNGTPGIRHLVVRVNGRRFALSGLADGETATIDLAGAMKPGSNTIVVTSTGRAGSKGTAVLHD